VSRSVSSCPYTYVYIYIYISIAVIQKPPVSSFGAPNCTLYINTLLYCTFIILYLYIFFPSKSRFFDSQLCHYIANSFLYRPLRQRSTVVVLYIHNLYDSFFTTTATSRLFRASYDFHKSSVPRSSPMVLRMKNYRGRENKKNRKILCDLSHSAISNR
jgi:hypothetical protein